MTQPPITQGDPNYGKVMLKGGRTDRQTDHMENLVRGLDFGGFILNFGPQTSDGKFGEGTRFWWIYSKFWTPDIRWNGPINYGLFVCLSFHLSVWRFSWNWINYIYTF